MEQCLRNRKFMWVVTRVKDNDIPVVPLRNICTYSSAKNSHWTIAATSMARHPRPSRGSFVELSEIREEKVKKVRKYVNEDDISDKTHTQEHGKFKLDASNPTAVSGDSLMNT